MALDTISASRIGRVGARDRIRQGGRCPPPRSTRRPRSTTSTGRISRIGTIGRIGKIGNLGIIGIIGKTHITFRTLFAVLVALVICASAVASVAIAAAPPAAAANWAPVHAGDFPDPSVLSWGGSYYGFATQNFAASGQTINVQVSTSIDGVTGAS